MPGDWSEGARRDDPADRCPGCGQPATVTWDFRKFGRHRLTLCLPCGRITVDGAPAASFAPRRDGGPA